MLSSKPKLIVLFLLLAVCVDIARIGPEIFWIESFGTLMLSPVIYVTLLPSGIGNAFNQAFYSLPALNIVICGIPILMLAGAGVLGALAFRRDSLGFALLATALVITVFAVYHLVQPMGFHVIT